jgi:hypothetical protein
VTWLGRFGRFWYDFLVGDRWELLVGPILALVLAATLLSAGVGSGAVAVVLVVSILGVAAFTLWRT